MILSTVAHFESQAKNQFNNISTKLSKILNYQGVIDLYVNNSLGERS